MIISEQNLYNPYEQWTGHHLRENTRTQSTDDKNLLDASRPIVAVRPWNKIITQRNLYNIVI